MVPIVNENDTVVTDEIKVGDNDTLAALVSNLIEAELLVILTDQAGLFTADPRRDPAAKLLAEVRAGDPTLEAMAGGAGSSIGKGGMITKVLAAKRAATSGASTVVCSGREPDVLVRLMQGEAIGTRFTAQTPRLAARKKWMADHLQLRGAVVLDAGAVKALLSSGSSLLPIGVTEVRGEFERGELVAILGPDGKELARGLVNYASNDARRVMRQPSQPDRVDPRLHRGAGTDPPRQPRPALGELRSRNSPCWRTGLCHRAERRCYRCSRCPQLEKEVIHEISNARCS